MQGRLETLTLHASLLPPALAPTPAVALVDLALQIAMFLHVRVDTLEVLHLQHKDEPFVRLFGEDLFIYIDALQNFRTRTSSGNPEI